MDFEEDLLLLPEEKEAIDLAKGTPKHVYNKSDYYINDMEYYSQDPALVLPFKFENQSLLKYDSEDEDNVYPLSKKYDRSKDLSIIRIKFILLI
jgi:hypothetical protein